MNANASTCCAGSAKPEQQPVNTAASACCAQPSIGAAATIYTEAVSRLVAIGAAIAANCEPCFKYHFQEAVKLGVSREDMMLAVKTAQSVKETPAKAMLELAHRFLEGDPSAAPAVKNCCG